jgi:hypothetical protein
MSRLEWLLDGLGGQAGWGKDAAEVLAPAFSARVTPRAFVELTRHRSESYAPLTVLGLEARGDTARAWIRRHGDPDAGIESTTDVATCTVEGQAPHRIVSTHTTGLVPDHVTPRLPATFEDYPVPRAPVARLIVFSGVPGTGKSTLADAVGTRLGIPVFATDWLLGALTPFGGRHLDDLLGIGAELLTTLALRQLALGQSAILDHPTENPAERERWRGLARHAGARFSAVVCVCSDPAVHRARLEGRTRGIPGWHDAGAWSNVERRMALFPAWPADALVVDTNASHEHNVTTLVDHLTA